LLASIIFKSHATAAFVECVNARPGEGPTGAFAFGRARGVIEGVLAAAGVPITFITPPAWKRAIGLTLKSKDAARSEAIRRWPDHAALFARVKDDGRAESALIGVAGQTARRPWPSRVHSYALGSAQGARAGLMNGADRKAVKSELRGHANGDRPARYLD
jgi:hypothetical protein